MRTYKEQKGDKNIHITRNMFNWKIYLERNPDIKNSGINNEYKAWRHWQKRGIYEKRPIYPETNIKNLGELGCLLSHLEVIKHASNNNYKNVIILEDDIILINNFKNRLKESMKKLKTDWLLLYLGATQKQWNNIDIKDGYYNANKTFGAFAYCINHKLYDEYISLLSTLTYSVDICLQILQNKYNNNSFVLYPNIIISDISISKIHKPKNMIEYSNKLRWDLNEYNYNTY